ncbi:transporter, partial [Escherichia coli]
IPAKGRRDVRGNAVSQTALHVVAAGPCPLFCPVPFTCLSPCRRGQRQPQPSPPVQG